MCSKNLMNAKEIMLVRLIVYNHTWTTQRAYSTQVSNWMLLSSFEVYAWSSNNPPQIYSHFSCHGKILKYREYKIWASASVRLSKLCLFFSSFNNRHQRRPQRTALETHRDYASVVVTQSSGFVLAVCSVSGRRSFSRMVLVTTLFACLSLKQN